MKSVFVPWSAGVDSTYLIIRLLESGYKVIAGYINIENNGAKPKMERAACDRIAKQLNDRFGQNFSYDGTIYKARNFATQNRSLRYRQVPYFLHSLLVAPLTDYRAIGYVSGDSAIKNLEKIRAIYNSYQLIYNRPLPKLVFPLKNTTKTRIYCYLTEHYEDILSNVVWCEQPIGSRYRACGLCHPCLRRNKELAILEQMLLADAYPNNHMSFTVPADTQWKTGS